MDDMYIVYVSHKAGGGGRVLTVALCRCRERLPLLSSDDVVHQLGNVDGTRSCRIPTATRGQVARLTRRLTEPPAPISDDRAYLVVRSWIGGPLDDIQFCEAAVDRRATIELRSMNVAT